MSWDSAHNIPWKMNVILLTSHAIFTRHDWVEYRYSRFKGEYYPFTSHGVKKRGTLGRVLWQRKKSLTSHEGKGYGPGEGEGERGLREGRGSLLLPSPILAPPPLPHPCPPSPLPHFPQSRKVWPLNSELYETEVLDGRTGRRGEREGARRKGSRRTVRGGGRSEGVRKGGGRKREWGLLLPPPPPYPPPPPPAVPPTFLITGRGQEVRRAGRRHDKPSFFLHMSLRLIARSLRSTTWTLSALAL